MMGLYIPGQSWLHRLTTGWKLLALIGITAAISASHEPIFQLAWLVAVLALYLTARLGLRPAWAALKALAPFLVLIAALQGLTVGWRPAAHLLLTLYTGVLLAGLFTLTTPLSSMLDRFERWLRPFARFGVNPWKISLVLALTIRLIPTVTRAIDIARDAFKARGFSRPGHRIILPVLIRLVRESEAIGDAIAARGLEEDPALQAAPNIDMKRSVAR